VVRVQSAELIEFVGFVGFIGFSISSNPCKSVSILLVVCVFSLVK